MLAPEDGAGPSSLADLPSPPVSPCWGGGTRPRAYTALALCLSELRR